MLINYLLFTIKPYVDNKILENSMVGLVV